MFQTGVGMVFLSRKTGARDVALGGFLVDAYCLGVKDAMFRELDEDEMEELLDGAGATAPLTPVDPPYARKLLRDAAAYAQSLGLPPHPDYPTAELLVRRRRWRTPAMSSSSSVTKAGRFTFPGRPSLPPRSGGESTACVDGSATTVSTSARRKTRSTCPMSSTTKWTTIPTSAPIPRIGLRSRRRERLRQAKDYHRRYDALLAEPEIHAAVHVVIENQIAMGDETPACEALERLMAEGLTRHEAVHALGSVFTEMIVAAANDKEAEGSHADAYNDAIARITAEDWRRLAAED